MDDCNLGKRLKILIVLGDMIPDMLNNKKHQPIITEIFISGRKLNTSIVFISQSEFFVPKSIRLNPKHHFLIQISSIQFAGNRTF